jgi:hypothetical protein
MMRIINCETGGMGNFYEGSKENDKYLSRDSQPRNSVEVLSECGTKYYWTLIYVLHKNTHILIATTGRHVQEAKCTSYPSSYVQF